jgi:hypothetical protein
MTRAAVLLPFASLLLACQEDPVISQLGCEFGDREQVVLSEFVEPVLGMPFPPARYVDALAKAHPVSVFRDDTLLGSHRVAPPGADAVELVIEGFRESATLQHWGPDSEFPNEPPCRYEELTVTATWLIRRPSDGLVLVGPTVTEIALSVDEIDQGGFGGTATVDAQWLEEIDAPTELPEYRSSSGFSWEDEENPDSRIDFKGTVIGVDESEELVAIAEFVSTMPR